MPFHYVLAIPAELSGGRMIKWMAAKGSYLHAGSELCLVECDGMPYVLRNQGRGALRDCHIGAGEQVHRNQPFATMDADGEDIPYGPPPVRVEPL